MGEHQPKREDVEALLETRRELGPAYEDALVDSFAERLERAVAERADAVVDERRVRLSAAVAARRDASTRQFVLTLVSLVACIPISIVLGLNDQLVPLLLALGAIVSVNVAHALQARPHD